MEPLAAISVFLGALSALLLLSMRVFPTRWARMFADAGREKGRPKWSWLAMVGSVIGVALVWYLHFSDGGTFSLAMALLCTFLLGRTVTALSSKAGMRQGMQIFLQNRVAVAFVPYTLVGIVLIVLALL